MKIPKPTQLEILDMNHFLCSENHGGTPFNTPPYTIRSTGLSVLASPLDPQYLVKTELIETINSLFKDVEKREYNPCPSIKYPEKDECDICDGVGHNPIEETCMECEGEKSVWISNEYNEYRMTCGTCSGRGRAMPDSPQLEPCENCHATGKIDDHMYLDVLGLNLSIKDVRFIEHTSNMKISPSIDTQMMYFKCGVHYGIFKGSIRDD